MSGTAPSAARVQKLVLMNPTPDKVRAGIVITPWQPIAAALGDPPAVRVYRSLDAHPWRKEMPAQIDRIDPEDPSRDQLVFNVEDVLLPGEENYNCQSGYATVEAISSPAEQTAGASVFALHNGVKFVNDRLDVFLNTSANHPHDESRKWFGGAAISVLLWNFEMLDALAVIADQEHHPEKRCMQLDRVHFVRPPWDTDGSVDIDLFDRHWECVATSNGPVRAVATIRSSPFDYTCKDVDGSQRTFRCAVYRVISIYRSSEFLAEEIWVKAVADGETTPANLWFTARYFMQMQLCAEPVTFRYPSHPGWFALTSPIMPFHGYAFATDALAGAIWNPPLDYVDEDTEQRAFSWELGATRRAHAVHIFRLGTTPQDLSDAAGWAWYDFAFKPLRAALIR